MRKTITAMLLAVSAVVSLMMTPVSAIDKDSFVDKTVIPYIDLANNVYWDIPENYVTREMQSESTWKSKAHWDFIGDKYGKPYVKLSGAYIEVTNIVKEYNNIWYSNGPVDVTLFGGERNYGLHKGIEAYTYGPEFINHQIFIGDRDTSLEDIENGVMRTGRYVKDDVYDHVGKHDDVGDEYNDVYKTTLTEPGYYLLYMLGTFGISGEVCVELYIAEPGEDVSRDPLTNPTATPKYVNISLNGQKQFNCPGYMIDDDYYVKIRDIAYMLMGTEKKFNVTPMPWYGYSNKPVGYSLAIDSYYHEYGNSNIYVPNGSEMAKLGTQPVQAKLNTSNVNNDGGIAPILTPMYSVAGNNYLSLNDFAVIFDFGYTADLGSGKASIDTSTVYKMQ